ncbi:MAG: hypothetical protein R3304_07625 [Longimicrobiales bacterium]|nr:hypothetical protein [Longimicrobiales bacterium]
MNVVDILISIVVVTILVTIILAIVTYVAYKLRLAREPGRTEEDPSALRYFVRYEPPRPEQPAGSMATGGEPGAVGDADASTLERLDRDVADMETHAS